MTEIIDLEMKQLWRDETKMSRAVLAATIESGEQRVAMCGCGRRTLEFCVKRIGERGDAKVQYYCDKCALGGEGWFPAGAWANK